MAQVPQPAHLAASWRSTLHARASSPSPNDGQPTTMVETAPVTKTPAPAMNSLRPTSPGFPVSRAILLSPFPKPASRRGQEVDVILVRVYKGFGCGSIEKLDGLL